MKRRQHAIVVVIFALMTTECARDVALIRPTAGPREGLVDADASVPATGANARDGSSGVNGLADDVRSLAAARSIEAGVPRAAYPRELASCFQMRSIRPVAPCISVNAQVAKAAHSGVRVRVVGLMSRFLNGRVFLRGPKNHDAGDMNIFSWADEPNMAGCQGDVLVEIEGVIDEPEHGAPGLDTASVPLRDVRLITVLEDGADSECPSRPTP